MGKLNWGISMLLAVSLVGLAGCSEQTSTREKELEERVAELEKQIAAYEKEEKEREQEEAEKKKEEEEQKPITVEIVHPETKEVIKTFTPLELGYGTKDSEFEKEIKTWAKEIARGTEQEEGYDQRMIPDRIGKDGQVIKGNPRVILEETELLERVVEASEKGGTVELPLYKTESGYKPEDVPTLGEAVVATYTTYYNTNVAGRSKNIELSAEAINNVILGTGDIFSFNTTVGPSDKAHGYQEAEEAVNGKLVMGVGGGICQTSSTLYNAIDKLGVKYVEHHNHSVNVGYVPKGRDATVSYGGVDFRFENTTGVPLLVKATTKNGSLTVEIRTSKAYKKQLKN
ncbi:VanW family protein [Bacillus sp. 31A1R]|uniref:VanW family protein n=1 Tax=Robertmurraya mangrovi TaxID=3098077 RepID=A0ABU5J2I0_9BACI|nr:VanW family protein [Bacillus sp. 31A1R]MDZ5473567.1 VanW family protein [Bacillus sp. 31A1R]